MIRNLLCCLMSLWLVACATGPKINEPITAIPIPDSEFLQVTNSAFGRFLITEPAAFSGFKKIILFPMQFDRLKLSETNKDLSNSWKDSDWDEMDEICEQFDYFATKVFKERGKFALAEKGAEDVLAVEFRLLGFTPYAKRHRDSELSSIGTSTRFSGIGEITIQAIFANAKTGELIAIVEDRMEVNAGTVGRGNLSMQVSNTNKPAQMLAWRKTFQRWTSLLHDELLRATAQSSTAI